MKYLFVTLVIYLPLFGCLSGKHMTKTPAHIEPDKEHISYVGTKLLSGYLYRFSEEKCPGTKSSEYNSSCTRIGFLYSESKIADLTKIIKSDSVILEQESIFVLDEFKLPFLLPSNILDDSISIGGMFNDYDLFVKSTDYASNLFSGFSDKQCDTERIKGMEIKGCKLTNVVTGLLFSSKIDLFMYGTSPSIGAANFGIPISYIGDAVSVLWLIPNDSPLLNKL